MSKIAPCLWFGTDAEQAAEFYVSLLPDSRIDHVQRSVIDNPSGSKGDVLIVEFTLAGSRFLALNGGNPVTPHPHAVSFSVSCDDQAEVDRLWDALLEDGGTPVECGWLRDRWGYPWQITPKRMFELLADPDKAKAARAMQAMMGMVKLDVAALEKAAEG